MREVLSLLVRLNFVASMAILLVLLFRLPTRRYLGAHQAYALWLVVPVSMIGALVLPVFGSEQIGLVEAVSGRVESWLSAGAHCMVLAGLWASGLVINIGLAAWRCGRFLALARAGRAGPAIFGVFAPRLVTPSDFSRRFTPEERRLVRAHERAHMDRLDARFNALTLAIQCLCWFNPLVHSAARTMRQDQELACDATVMLRFPMERRRYAETLLRSLESSTISPLGCG